VDVPTALGERLDLVNVSRYCADVYECTASNDVPPHVKRHIRLTVECRLRTTLTLLHRLLRGAGDVQPRQRQRRVCFGDIFTLVC